VLACDPPGKSTERLRRSETEQNDPSASGLGLRGRAVLIDDPDARARYCDAVTILGWRPQEPYFHLFCVEIADVTLIRYESTGDQHVARWPSGTEFVRRATSPTSVGAKEPIYNLFRPE
jgi:hypothetical protein